MASVIEDIIDELEEYIESCKPAMLSNTNIIVNKDEIDALLDELRSKTPDEIRRYQKIINNKEAILADAQKRADAIIAQAQIETDELVSEHQIMQQAYARANEVVMVATKQADEILSKATTDANNIRTSAMAYTDDLLSNIQSIISGTIDTTLARNESYVHTMQEYLNMVVSNRNELNPGANVLETADNINMPASIDVPDELF